MKMNGRNRLLLNTILGVILAVSMTVGLATLSTLNQTSTTIQAEAPVEELAPKIGDAQGERSLDIEAAPSEEQAFASIEEGSGLEVFTTIDPVNLGTPFAVALIAGLATFMIVRSRVVE